MLAKLKNDAFIFSGLKTHAQLLEASSLLTDKDGKIKSFDSFAHDFNKINQNYNQNYLQAEWQFAVSSSQSAANWATLDDSGRHYLQYRTANDDRVRENHRVLHNTTLPKDDPFWLSYYPPNGWRCRCVAVEVLKDKYPLSDSETSIKNGEKATTQIGKDGKNKLEIFRFNPGMEQKVFPPKHPYNKVKDAEKVKSKIETPLTNIKDLNKHFEKFATENEEFFARGFKEIKITRQKNVNGFTDMNGSIALKPDITDNIISAINAIKAGNKTTFEQEQSLSTLHHEIWHNANKPGNMRMSTSQIKTMELANEFVSRKTLPEFMKKLGGDLQHTELTQNRANTGYNRMVKNYDQLIKWAESNPKKVLEDVKKHLIEASYDDQLTGLRNAITNNSKYKISEKAVSQLIELAKDKNYTEEKFKELLENNKKLLVNRD